MASGKQRQAPLYAALRRHVQRRCAHLHVPAHRQGEALPSSLKGEDFFQLDLTELPGLDDLHSPGGPIARAQELAAKLYGARATFFLVNGTTAGVTALFLAACRPGQKVVVTRDAHRSVLAGLVLSGADPVFVAPRLLPPFGIPAAVRPEDLSGALRAHPEARGVFVVYPNYYGVAADLPALAGVARRHGKPFFVDEAHGAHFPFHPDLPPEALACGADAAVMSVHKTGGSLTQSSFLHLGGEGLLQARVAAALSLLQTSSPSYLLLASLDLARRQLAVKGFELLARALALARRTRAALSAIPGLAVFGEEEVPAGERLDPLRITIGVRELGLSGYRAAALLAQKYRVHCELADNRNIVAAVGIGTREEDCSRLVSALTEISRTRRRRRSLPEIPRPPAPPPKRMTPREAWFAPARTVSLEAARRLVSSEWVAVSPPGVPVIYPGEEITPEVSEYLQFLRANGISVTGPTDRSLATIRVVC
jgi:arginine/lysine/ornithine decarboxylase